MNQSPVSGCAGLLQHWQLPWHAMHAYAVSMAMYHHVMLGGLLTPTATEYIASPFNVSSLGKNESSTIYFCINGLNGGRPDENGECPIPEVDIASQNLVTAATSSAPSVNGWGKRYMFWCTGAPFILYWLM